MSNFSRWALIAGTVLLLAVVGTVAYNAGLAHGFEQSGKVIAAPAAPYPYPVYGWHPWGFGHFLGPLFFVAFWIVLVRALFGRGRWHGAGCGREGRFEEWHRRMHERMGEVNKPGPAPAAPR